MSPRSTGSGCGSTLARASAVGEEPRWRRNGGVPPSNVGDSVVEGGEKLAIVLR